MNLSDETIIPLSRTKILLLIIGAAAFAALGLWLFYLDDQTITHMGRDPEFVHGVGLAAIIFAGLCAILGARKLFDRRPGLRFTTAGIVDNASGVAVGLVPWSDITGTEIYRVSRTRMLVVKVTDPEKYIAVGGAMRRSVNRMNFNMCGSPIVLSPNTLAIKFDELVRLFDVHLAEYGDDRSRGSGAVRSGRV
jgi:hypothetical protein